MHELSAWDRTLLEKHLWFYEELHSGRREPKTVAQEHFVKVCRGNCRPRTQHEIAYKRFLSSKLEGISRDSGRPVQAPKETLKPIAKTTSGAFHSQPTEAAIAAVDEMDQLLVELKPNSRAARFLRSAKDLYLSGTSMAQSVRKDAALWLTMALSTPELARSLSRWAGEQFNTLSNEVTKAMDGSFTEGLNAGAEYQAPHLHRLFGGHTFEEAMQKARDVMPEASEPEIAWEAVRALASDMSSYAGLPLTTFSREGFAQAKQIAERFGVSESMLADALTVNATELLAAVVPAIALLFGWNKNDRDEFTKSLGALSIVAVASANPLLIVMIVVAAALDFHRNGKARRIDQGAMAIAFAKGGALSGIVLSSSAVIAGPAWIGVVCGIVLAVATQQYVNTAHFRDIGENLIDQIEYFVPKNIKASVG